jgi:hypothetical protein
MLDGKATELVGTVHLSNNTIFRQIGDLGEDVKDILPSRIKCTKFSLQMDESTDVAGLAILIVLVRYRYLETFQENLLLCKPFPTDTSGAEIFKLTEEFFTVSTSHGITALICAQTARTPCLKRRPVLSQE